MGELGARAGSPELADAVVHELIQAMASCVESSEAEGLLSGHLLHPAWEYGIESLRLVGASHHDAASTLLKVVSIVSQAEEGGEWAADLLPAFPYDTWPIANRDMALISAGLLDGMDSLHHTVCRSFFESVLWGIVPESGRLIGMSTLFKMHVAHLSGCEVESRGGVDVGSSEKDVMESNEKRMILERWLWSMLEKINKNPVGAAERRGYHDDEHFSLREHCTLQGGGGGGEGGGDGSSQGVFPAAIALSSTDAGVDPLLLGIFGPLYERLVDSGHCAAASEIILHAMVTSPKEWLLGGGNDRASQGMLPGL